MRLRDSLGNLWSTKTRRTTKNVGAKGKKVRPILETLEDRLAPASRLK
jgi:hypothetical protein